MKKIFIGLLAFAGLMTSCLQKENALVYFNPEKSVAPSVQAIEGITLNKEGEAIKVAFSGIQLDINAPKTYTLYASPTEDFAKAEKLAASFGADSFTIAQKDLNATILNLGGVADEAFTIYLRVSAWMANDKGNAIESSLKLSNVISATFTPYNQLILDKDMFEHVWVIGDYCGWVHDKTQFLYNYSKDGKTFTGVVDFGEKASNGFKLTNAADWNHGNWGSADQSETSEQETIQLVDGSGSMDIKCLSHRFYNFTFDSSSLVLVPGAGFDSVGLVGTINAWGESPDIPMEYNADFVRFWCDYEFTEAAEIKCRADSAWDINWGAGTTPGGDNVKVEPGKYRVYLDLNKKTLELNESMYGKEEPTANPGGDEEEVPVVENAWAVIGEVQGSSWDKDFYMTEKDGIWTSEALNITGGFKVRFNNEWTENFGGTFVEAGVAFEAVADGSDITPEPGYYTVVLDPTAKTITLNSMANKWSLIGTINGSAWDKDFFMTEADGVWTSEPVTIADVFKVRFNTSWDDANTRGIAEGATLEIGVAFDAVSPGGNITVPAEDRYIVVYDSANEKITINKALPQNAWSLIGVNGDWNNDIYMTELSSGLWVSGPVTMSGNFKLRFNNEWTVNAGGVMANLGEAFEVTQDGANIKLPAEANYQVIYNPILSTVTINTCDSWSLIGAYENFSWDTDIFLSPIAEGIYKSIAVRGTQIKLRKNADWGVNRGGIFEADGTPFAAVDGGDNINLPNENALYTVTYDSNNETIVVGGTWALIGQVNGTSWDKDFVMTETSEGVWEAMATVNGGFKIRYCSDWGVNRGGALANLGEAFAVEQEGADIGVPTVDAKYRIVYKVADETITVTAVE